ncbi:MAG: glutamine--fructose-6-phosphate transaminase (isomerizing), partial [Ruminococcus sp.]|nr:glutamine--fructose-6-phosphate transaminase (isomerizing) [Candidatus Copronaster equi]
MCGIMGYIGKEDAAKIIINGLEELEYRGYDSAGIAVNNGKKINIEKVLGSPSNLRKSIDKLYGYMGIGHTRWATHGAPTRDNAHPHISRNGKFIVVHNGIIENYNELKTELINDGFEFKSETDTEVIAQLLEKHYFGDLKGAVKSVLPLLKGSYALGIMCSDYDDVLVCAKKSSPLFIGTSDNCGYIASDISALDDKSKRIFRLNDGEIGFLKNNDFKVYDIDGCRIKKSEVKIKKTEKLNGRAGYEHFMLKEIFEQPDAVKNTLNEIINNDSIIFKDFKYNSDEIKRINNIRFVACGSAYHAGKVGAYVTERLLNINSEACIASEFRYSRPHLDEDCLVVIISQSGETADTLAALRMAKEMNAKAISIVNVESSTIA